MVTYTGIVALFGIIFILLLIIVSYFYFRLRDRGFLNKKTNINKRIVDIEKLKNKEYWDNKKEVLLNSKCEVIN